MSETSGNQDHCPKDPELAPSQLVVKELCEDILKLWPPGSRLTFEDVAVQADPQAVQERLRSSSVGVLMLQDGDSLSAVPSDGYRPDLDLFVGQAKLVAVRMRNTVLILMVRQSRLTA
ncbi:MAG TPA: hypothetical protein VK978_03665 [Candidatus Saccharimonadales bacterium]|nr:hypothetical protein [Candidatus Saccharimonadales bacterium]